jgi:hypothetical protein
MAGNYANHYYDASPLPIFRQHGISPLTQLGFPLALAAFFRLKHRLTEVVAESHMLALVERTWLRVVYEIDTESSITEPDAENPIQELGC